MRDGAQGSGSTPPIVSGVTEVGRSGGAAAGTVADGVADAEDERPPVPWHFKVLLVGTVLYLVYRFVWFIFWLTGHAWHG